MVKSRTIDEAADLRTRNLSTLRPHFSAATLIRR
jgi:hypothetical protein